MTTPPEATRDPWWARLLMLLAWAPVAIAGARQVVKDYRR